MYKNKTYLAIVPARGGSKGLPGKNIKYLCGKPLISWSIHAGLKSNYVDEVMVTTDDQSIANVAVEHGAKVPFLRPSYLASDTSTSFDTVKHAIEYYKETLLREFDYVVLLEPTSPMRLSTDIDEAIEMLHDSGADAIVGVCKTEDQNPAFLVQMDPQRYIAGYENKGMKVLRRQDVDDVYFFEGSVYISKTEVLLQEKTFYHKNTIGYEVPKYKSLEIDDMDDYIMVEALMKHRGYE